MVTRYRTPREDHHFTEPSRDFTNHITAGKAIELLPNEIIPIEIGQNLYALGTGTK